MNRYTVVWDKAVEADYLNSWMSADSPARAALTELANTIDRALGYDADVLGEPQQSEIGTRAVVIHESNRDITVYSKPSAQDLVVRVTRFVVRYDMH
jgi:hypothetical protein